LASGKALCLVTYTGKETRMSMNSNKPKQKLGKLEKEINKISKFLFIVMIVLAFGLSVQSF
jgi:phospholipid-translocating ATPase